MFFRRSKISRGYHNIVRYKQIIAVLIKHGFRDFVENSNLLRSFNLKRKILGSHYIPPKSKPVVSHWQRIRLVLEELGPTFIKLGQFLSNRPDIIPSELCQELEKLLDIVSTNNANLIEVIPIRVILVSSLPSASASKSLDSVMNQV